MALTLLGFPRLMNGAMEGINAFLNMLDKVPPSSGDRSAVMAPVKEPGLHHSLDQQQSLTEGGFGDPDALCRLCEGALLVQGDDQFEIANLQTRCQSRTSAYTYSCASPKQVVRS
jgi:hypothetical protein